MHLKCIILYQIRWLCPVCDTSNERKWQETKQVYFNILVAIPLHTQPKDLAVIFPLLNLFHTKQPSRQHQANHSQFQTTLLTSNSYREAAKYTQNLHQEASCMFCTGFITYQHWSVELQRPKRVCVGVWVCMYCRPLITLDKTHLLMIPVPHRQTDGGQT